MNINKYDLYIGKEITCICGLKCHTDYTIISDIYEKDGQEVFDAEDENGNVETIWIDFLNEYAVV